VEIHKGIKSINTVRACLSVLLILASFTLCRNQKIEWKGSIDEVDGITIVRNLKEPIYSENVLELKEDLSIGEAESGGEYMFSQIRDIAVDEAENIYVLDMKERQIKVFDEKGRYLRTIGKKGQGPGELGIPAFMSITNQNEVVVEDPGNRRLTYYALNGDFLSSTSTAKMTIAQTKIDSLGNILGVVQNIEKKVWEIRKFDPDFNRSLCSFGTDPLPRDYRTYNPFKSSMRWEVYPDDCVICGFPAEYELQVFDPEGKLIRKITKEYDPVKITPEEIEEAEKRAPPGRKLEIPKYHESFVRVSLTDRGRIIVQTRKKTDDRKQDYYDVFDRDGRYVARVPLRMRPRIWKKDKLYTIEEDEEGFQVVKRYNVSWNI